jgi:hypothetical protein
MIRLALPACDRAGEGSESLMALSASASALDMSPIKPARQAGTRRIRRSGCRRAVNGALLADTLDATAAVLRVAGPDNDPGARLTLTFTV